MNDANEQIVDRIAHLIESGEKPENVEGALRATGWPQIEGKDITKAAYTGLLTIAVFEIQNRMRKRNRLNVNECRAQLWDMARSFVSVCLATGELKYVADGLKVMGSALQIEPPKKKLKEVPNQTDTTPFEAMSDDELRRIAAKRAE